MKQLLTTFAIAAISAVLLVACSNTANESGTNTAASNETKKSFDLSAARKTIDSINVVFATLSAKGDSVGLAALYTADGKAMPPNMPSASGRGAIQSAFSGMFGALGPIEIKPTTVELWGDENMLAEEGTYVMNKGGKEFDRGKYIVLWKMEDGKWKLFRDCVSSDLHSAPPPK